MTDQQYLYRLQLCRGELLTSGPTDAEAQVLQAHAAYVQHLADESTVLLAGRTQTDTPDTFGIVIFRAASRAAAQAIMQADPAVQNGVMQAQLFPYHIASLAPDINVIGQSTEL
ncbi:MAG: YciI family protein [Pseudomonadota bacterium]